MRDVERTGLFAASAAPLWCMLKRMQNSFEKVRGSKKAPRKMPPAKPSVAQKSADADAEVGLQKLSWLLACGKVPMCWCLPALGVKRVCCLPPKRKEGVSLGLNIKRPAGRGHSGCPGALQTNRGPRDPATTRCIEPSQGPDLRGRQHSDRPVTTYIDVALSTIPWVVVLWDTTPAGSQPTHPALAQERDGRGARR